MGVALKNRGGLLLFVWLALVSVARAELGSPTPQDRQAAIGFSQAVEREHFLKIPLSAVSARIHKVFLDTLDPDSLYLTEEDRKSFARLEGVHGDQIKAGDFSAAWEMFHTLLQRKREKIPPVVQALAKGEMPAGNSTLEKYVRDDLEIRMKAGTPRPDAVKLLKEDLERGLQWTSSATTGQVVEVYLDSAAVGLDPHSSYMSSTTFDSWKAHVENGFDGIGVYIGPAKGGLEIQSLVPGGAAAEEGSLQPGHRIVGASQDGRNFVDFDKVPFEKANQLLKGPQGTDVYLKVVTRDGEPPSVLKLPRKHVELEDGKVKLHIVELPIEGEKLPIAIIDLPSYYSDPDHGVSMAKDVYDAIATLGQSGKGVAGIIIDQRGNGGGSIDEVVHLVGLVNGKVPAVQVTDYAGDKTGDVYIPRLRQIYDGPLMVLIDKRSASASEIFAGAVQDYGRGIIVGDSRTFGKGSVQQVFGLGAEELGAAKLTIQGFFRPRGKTTQHGGVESDVVFSSGWDQMKIGEHSLPNPLQFSPISPVAEVHGSHVTPELLAKLREQHEARVKADPALAALTAQIAEFRKLLDSKGDGDTSGPADELSKRGAMGKVELKSGVTLSFGEDPYTREVLHLLADYAVILDENNFHGVRPDVTLVQDNPAEPRQIFSGTDCPYQNFAVRVVRPRRSTR